MSKNVWVLTAYESAPIVDPTADRSKGRAAARGCRHKNKRAEQCIRRAGWWARDAAKLPGSEIIYRPGNLELPPGAQRYLTGPAWTGKGGRARPWSCCLNAQPDLQDARPQSGSGPGRKIMEQVSWLPQLVRCILFRVLSLRMSWNAKCIGEKELTFSIHSLAEAHSLLRFAFVTIFLCKLPIRR